MNLRRARLYLPDTTDQNPFLPDTGGDENGGGAGTPPPAPESAQKPTTEYPAGTPLVEMTPEQQAAYWKAHARKHEGTAKDRAAELERVAAENEKLRRKGMDEQELAIAAARDEARESARAELAGELVTAKIEAAAAARGIAPESLATLLSAIDPSKFLSGAKPDADAISAFVAALPSAGPVPPATGTTPPPATGPSFQGRSSGRPSTERSGADLYEQYRARGAATPFS